MRNIIRLLLPVTILSTLISCKKDKTDTAQFSLAFTNRALEYVQLTEGKYLIYKDSATLQLDSVVVTKSQLQSYFNPAQLVSGQDLPAYTHEGFELVLTKYAGTTNTEWFEGSASTGMLSLPSASSDTAALILSDLNNFTEFYFRESTQTNYSMTVEGRTFNNVVVIITDPFLGDITNPNYKKAIYYWAKGIGIIKSETTRYGGSIKTYTLLRNN